MTDMTNYYMIYMYHIYSHNLCLSVIYGSLPLGRFLGEKKNLYFLFLATFAKRGIINHVIHNNAYFQLSCAWHVLQVQTDMH